MWISYSIIGTYSYKYKHKNLQFFIILFFTKFSGKAAYNVEVKFLEE
ncbi:hypothetical protein HMPREF0083_02545 [Aneurinibacillus aneurinilyticus ATCC 12856]|uniref:Uncharacterized protein n=1 Tax=Aneurinibacillus aneurinilyticus ATCC 12856 TaxID=649747 RepID=U1X329_ANEAE|nr:hypothetical protein HMPREF0083_02545 [Aneurinibacillus aneurinilyticus ATCC 12856]